MRFIAVGEFEPPQTALRRELERNVTNTTGKMRRLDFFSVVVIRSFSRMF